MWAVSTTSSGSVAASATGEGDWLESSRCRRRGPDGRLIDTNFRKESRGLAYALFYYEISPTSAPTRASSAAPTERQGSMNASCRWWPQNWIVNWGIALQIHNRNYEFSGKCGTRASVSAGIRSWRNINFNVNTDRDMERYNAVDFPQGALLGGHGHQHQPAGVHRRLHNWGDQIRYVTNPYLGRGRNGNTSRSRCVRSRACSRS